MGVPDEIKPKLFPEEALQRKWSPVFSENLLVLDVSTSEWQKCFENWFKRMQKCIALQGEYFEKQLIFSVFSLLGAQYKGNPRIRGF